MSLSDRKQGVRGEEGGLNFTLPVQEKYSILLSDP